MSDLCSTCLLQHTVVIDDITQYRVMIFTYMCVYVSVHMVMSRYSDGMIHRQYHVNDMTSFAAMPNDRPAVGVPQHCFSSRDGANNADSSSSINLFFLETEA